MINNIFKKWNKTLLIRVIDFLMIQFCTIIYQLITDKNVSAVPTI